MSDETKTPDCAQTSEPREAKPWPANTNHMVVGGACEFCLRTEKALVEEIVQTGQLSSCLGPISIRSRQPPALATEAPIFASGEERCICGHVRDSHVYRTELVYACVLCNCTDFNAPAQPSAPAEREHNWRSGHSRCTRCGIHRRLAKGTNCGTAPSEVAASQEGADRACTACGLRYTAKRDRKVCVCEGAVTLLASQEPTTRPAYDTRALTELAERMYAADGYAVYDVSIGTVNGWADELIAALATIRLTEREVEILTVANKYREAYRAYSAVCESGEGSRELYLAQEDAQEAYLVAALAPDSPDGGSHGC